MKKKLLVSIVLLFAAFSMIIHFSNESSICVSHAAGTGEAEVKAPVATVESALNASTSEAAVAGKISLYEFGAGKCVQCKNMKPIIEELQKELDGKVEVKLFDVNSDAELTEKHKIVLIPCQLFLDCEGKELFRHEGFFSKDEILAKLKEFGAKL